MYLRSLQRQWDRLARKDPLWAVLSLPDKRGGRWDEAEFFATGDRDVLELLHHAREAGFSLKRDRALDFGCGVGRLTQALCAHFERCDGVDIAPSMLALAKRYNRHPEKCQYHLNTASDLSLFADRSFSFICTSLVLQHMRPELSRSYLREFVRLLGPGGLLVFHLPTERFPASAAGAPRTAAARELPPAAFRAGVTPAQADVGGDAGALVTLKVRVTNLSPEAWPSLGAAGPRFQITLGNRWLDAGGRLIKASDARSPLPHDLGPSQSTELFLTIQLPPQPGDYVLELDLVQENVAWFAERGSTPARISCRAEGKSTGDLWTPPAGREQRPFQLRYPRLHAALARLPFVRAVSATVHSLHTIVQRGRRDLLWRVYSARQIWGERLKQALDPPMEMNGIPRSEVVELLTSCGGHVLEVENAELTHAGWQAYRYWVTRPPLLP